MQFGGAAVLIAGVGCSDSATSGGTLVAEGGTDGGSDGPVAVDAAYGGPPFDASFDGPISVDAAYGGPPPFDAGRDGAIPIDAADGAPPLDGGRD